MAATFLTLALVKYSYLDSVSLNFSNAITQGREGLLVIDSNHRILYHNGWVHGIFGDFKRYDDAFRLPAIKAAFLDGHQVGDEVLIIFAEAVKRTVRRYTSVNIISGRLGGDEFCLFMENMTDKRVVADFAQALIEGFDTVLTEYGREGVTALSLGISLVHGIVMPASASAAYARMHNLADQALYNAKNAGAGIGRRDPPEAYAHPGRGPCHGSPHDASPVTLCLKYNSRKKGAPNRAVTAPTGRS